MAQPSYGTALRHIHKLFNVGTIGALTDGHLLERFTICDQEAAELAFAALVERHGPMVLRVCQSVVRERHDAEDAFQATFLVLVRKAASIQKHESVVSWLHPLRLERTGSNQRHLDFGRPIGGRSDERHVSGQDKARPAGLRTDRDRRTGGRAAGAHRCA